MAGKLLQNPKIILPTDVVVADKFDANAEAKIVDVDSMPDAWLGLDIGPETIKNYKQTLDEGSLIMTRGKDGERIPMDEAQRNREMQDAKKILEDCKAQ